MKIANKQLSVASIEVSIHQTSQKLRHANYNIINKNFIGLLTKSYKSLLTNLFQSYAKAA